MNRREKLNEIFKDINKNEKELIDPLIDELVFLENQMDQLKKLPFIRVHPKNPAKQETTPAAKQYKECSQSYMNAIRILCSLIHKDDNQEESPLRQYLKEMKDKYVRN